MKQIQTLLDTYRRKLQKALHHLNYSYNKIINLPEKVEELDDESLETWESFSARFARVVDIFLMKYLRTLVLLNDPGFAGSLRDFMNQAEKLGFVENVNTWMAIRELRNISAHEYSEEDLTEFFIRLKKECPQLLNIKLNSNKDT